MAAAVAVEPTQRSHLAIPVDLLGSISSSRLGFGLSSLIADQFQYEHAMRLHHFRLGWTPTSSCPGGPLHDSRRCRQFRHQVVL